MWYNDTTDLSELFLKKIERAKMPTELPLYLMIVLPAVAFVCEYVDSTLGMGYGTTLTPLLLLFGFSPLQIVPIVLLSELISGLLAGYLHHKQGNVNFKPKSINLLVIAQKVKEIGYLQSFKKGVPRHLKIALVLATCSIIGTVAAVFIAVNIPKFWLKFYIGFIVLSMGIIILFTYNKNFGFSWKKITTLGLIASFNKGMSGGGYGPIVTGGQILSGVQSKNAIAITSLAEGLTCAVGIATYILVTKNTIDWTLLPYIVIGAVLSVPFSTISVKNIPERKLKIAIAFLTITLGTITLINVFK